VAKGQYLIVADEELDAIEIASTHTIEIDSFVPPSQIDQRFFDTPGARLTLGFPPVAHLGPRETRCGCARATLTVTPHLTTSHLWTLPAATSLRQSSSAE